MVMCNGCTDWFHENCIRTSNASHNLADPQFHADVIPGIPVADDIDSHDFFCARCVGEMLWIPGAYRKYIYVEPAEGTAGDQTIAIGQKRDATDGCPVANAVIPEKFPYHIFLTEAWFSEKCACESC
jgi:hypothetical protein